jgi:ABC-2 type transport system permease protein
MTAAHNAMHPAQQTQRLHPVWMIAGKTLSDLRRDARWGALFVLALLLMAAALALGLQREDRLAHEQHAAQAGDYHVWTQQGDKNPHAAAHFGQYAFKPVGPLALADPGVDPFVGNTVWLEAHRQNETQFRAARDATLAARMGALDMAFVLQIVMPLMAILLGHAAMASEREQGTLGQLLALGVHPSHLLAGKALACAGVLATMLLVACGGLWVGLEVAGHGSTEVPEQGLRLLGLGLCYGLVLLGFLALGLAVSALVRSPRVALVGLLAFWLFNSFLVPRWMTDTVRRADPLPTAQSFRAAIAADKKQLFGHDENHPGFIAFRDSLLKQYAVARIEDLPVSFRGLALREDDQAGYLMFDRHFGRLQAQLEAQDQRRALPGFVFPMLALQPLSMALAGTDNRHHHHFVNAAEGQRRLIQTLTSQDLIDHAGRNAEYKAPASLWQRVPPLQYTAPPAAWAVQGQGRNLAALLVWCTTCCALVLVVARKMHAP